MTLRWDKTLETGVAMIDEQHRELFEKVGELSEAFNDGRGKEEVENMVFYLSDYVNSHFRTEERHMDKSGFPGMNEHKKQHSDFVSTFNSLANDLKTNGVTDAFVFAVNNTVVEWLMNHINKSDRALARHLKKA